MTLLLKNVAKVYDFSKEKNLTRFVGHHLMGPALNRKERNSDILLPLVSEQKICYLSLSLLLSCTDVSRLFTEHIWRFVHSLQVSNGKYKLFSNNF